MKFSSICILFSIFRIFDLVVIYLFSRFFPYHGSFPNEGLLLRYNLPHLFSSFANFDGINYLRIVENGYEIHMQAFFPLYPILIKILTYITQNALVSGILISNLSMLLGLWILSKFIKNLHLSSHSSLLASRFSLLSSLFLLLFPTSFYLGAVYTEGLFFLLVVLTLYFLQKKKYGLVCITSFLAPLTRLMGVFLIVPIWIYLKTQRLKIKDQKPILTDFNRLQLVLTFIAPILGLTTYCIYLWITTKDPILFYHVQPAFGANRSTDIILLPQVIWRYLKILATLKFDASYYVSIFEITVFVFILSITCYSIWKSLYKKYNYQLFAVSSFSLVNTLLSSLTGTLLSVPRFALLSLSVFIMLAEYNNTWVKIGIAVVFLLVHIMVLGLFSQGFFMS